MKCKNCQRLEAERDALREQVAHIQGMRGQARHRADGFSTTQTRLLRILAASGELFYSEAVVARHMSNIRAILRERHPEVKIKTRVGEGYYVVSGREILQRLVAGVNPKAVPQTIFSCAIP